MDVRMNRRGNAAAIVGLSMGALLGFAALATDVGLMQVSNSELQVSADAAALAGASWLDGTSEGLANAVVGATNVGSMNNMFGQSVQVNTVEVKLGIYDPDTGNFEEVTTTYNDPGRVNAVRVDMDRQTSSILARAMPGGFQELPAYGAATALRPTGGSARRVECYLPFAMPDCYFTNYLDTGTNPPPLMFTFSNNNNDTVGWGLPTINIGASFLNAQLAGQCGGETLEVEDTLFTDNGVKNSTISFIADIINGNSSVPYSEGPTAEQVSNINGFSWPIVRDGVNANIAQNSEISANNWGNAVEGVVALVDFGDDCTNIDFFRQEVEITGFVYAYVYDVKSSGGGGGGGGNNGRRGGGGGGGSSSAANVWLWFDLVNERELGTGYDADGMGSITGRLSGSIVQ